MYAELMFLKDTRCIIYCHQFFLTLKDLSLSFNFSRFNLHLKLCNHTCEKYISEKYAQRFFTTLHRVYSYRIRNNNTFFLEYKIIF